MPNFRLSRRAMLRGAGSIAIALPWLEIMRDERKAHAASQFAQRFIAVYTPGGTVHESAQFSTSEQWTPTGTEADFVLSPILSPYEPVKPHLVVLQGIDMKSAIGEQQQSGVVGWLTGTAQPTGAGSYAGGPSLDQALKSQISGTRPFPSLELAVRWGTGKTMGQMTPYGVMNFADDAAFTPRPPLLDPVDIWHQLFGKLSADSTPPQSFDKSILDYLAGRYSGLSARLGNADKARIDEHLTRIRELEQALSATVAARCRVPTLIDTSDYDPYSGLHTPQISDGSDGDGADPTTDAAIPKVAKLMIDMLVMALACEQTAVASFMWTDSIAKHSYPWLGLDKTLWYYENNGGYWPKECAQIGTWYASQNSYLLQQLASVDMGGHSLLDETVVFFGSEVSNPATHLHTDMPFLLAGGGGGLRGGRFLRYESASHNDLLVSILNLFGDARSSFGTAHYCTGPLPNLV